MTDLTDDQVQALLDGATPGPWRADGEPWNRIVWSSADNRVCFMAHSSGLNDARDIATSNLVAAAPDLARALLDARAELARVKTDAAAAMALMVAQAATQADPWDGPVTKNKLVDAQAIAAQQIKARIRALAPADGLAAVEALRVEARENAMQALASMGQAQEAYEAQLEAEAELARVRADAAAAQAMVVERAAKVPRLHAKQLQQNGLTAMSSDFDHIEEDIRALAPADGLAAVEALRKERDRFEAALGRACLVGGTTYLIEIRDRLVAELAAAQQREAGLVERAEKAEAERDKWFEGAGAHHVASMQQAQRADIAEAELAAIRNGETS
jgi:hypothetical protein